MISASILITAKGILEYLPILLPGTRTMTMNGVKKISLVHLGMLDAKKDNAEIIENTFGGLLDEDLIMTVSYTHLTLPTICSV